MISFKTNIIIVPVDFSLASQKAIHHAAFLAELNKGELILLHIFDKKIVTESPETASDLRAIVRSRQEAEQRLKAMAEDIHKKYGIPVKIRILSGKKIKGIVQSAEELGADLIVMGTLGTDSTSSLFFGSNASRVLSKTAIPIMTVRNHATKIGYTHVLLPVTLSEHSRQKINYAIQLAKIFAAKIHVLGILGDNQSNQQYKMKVILQQITKLAESRSVSMDTRQITTDDAVTATLSIAEKINADLVIAMTDDHQSNSLFFNHQFDQALSSESDIPVLSLPPELAEESFENISIAGH